MFSKKSIGLDIADHTLEVVELEQNFLSSHPSIKSFGRLALEQGIVVKGRVVNKRRLQEALVRLWQSTSPAQLIGRSFIFGVPESQVYTSVITIECDRKNLHEQVLHGAYQTIPIEKDDLALSYVVFSEKEQECKVLLYGTSREVLHEWNDFFEDSGMQVNFFDHELLAIIRGLFGDHVSRPACIVDIGAERTKIALISESGLQYVYALECAGDVFTHELAKKFEITEIEAENVKRKDGMNAEKAYPIFEQLLSPIIQEINTAFEFHKRTDNGSIVELILVGGSSRLLGLKEYFAKKLGVRVAHGSPFLELKDVVENSLDHLHYIEALGLALRGLDAKWERAQPPFKLI